MHWGTVPMAANPSWVKGSRIASSQGISYPVVGLRLMNHADAKLIEGTALRQMVRNPVFWFQVASVAILIGFLYYDILGRLVADWWNDPNFSHGFLVPAFSAFVFWQNRKHLAVLPRDGSWFGLAVIAGALAVLIVGELGAEFFLSRASLVFLSAGLAIYFLGWRHFRAVLFPWAFLLFMIPIPVIIFNQVAFPLQFLAARLATFLLELFGVPVLREGNIIQLPTTSLEVAQACSGIRSLMSLGALAVIYGYFLETRWLPRLLLALAAIPIAVAANGLRVMVTGLLGYYWEPDKAEGFFHTFSGWVIFVISLAMLFAFHAGLRWIWTPRTGPGAVKR
jgi:exosortase